MRFGFLTLSLICLLITQNLYAQEIRIVKFDAIENLMHISSDSVYVLNFFASWCKPCVEELSEFISFQKEHAQDKLRVIFVSLDFKKDQESALLPLLKKLEIDQPVWLLDEPDANTWIRKLDRKWSGAIPATLIIDPKKRRTRFYSETLSKVALNSMILE